jgi:hypothetical protein
MILSLSPLPMNSAAGSRIVSLKQRLHQQETIREKRQLAEISTTSADSWYST